MGAPLSQDLRRRIVAAVAANDSTYDEIAARFDVGVATVYRLARLHRETGDVKPGKTTGRRRRLTDEDLSILRGLVLEKPDRLLRELLVELEKHTGKHIGQATMSRSLALMDLTRKKRGFTRLKPTRHASKKPARSTHS